MDFLDFNGEKLYFDEPVSSEVEKLLNAASKAGRADSAEAPLLRAYFLEPTHLTVLVALYRFYYYRQRLDDALMVADRAMDAAGAQLGLHTTWDKLSIKLLGHGVLVSMGLTRFYLHALKASGFMFLRMQRISEALERLNKLAELDPSDQFGARPLIEIAKSVAGEFADDIESKELKMA